MAQGSRARSSTAYASLVVLFVSGCFGLKHGTDRSSPIAGADGGGVGGSGGAVGGSGGAVGGSGGAVGGSGGDTGGGGACESPAKTPGQACANGYCNALAQCVSCLSDMHCAASDECHDPRCDPEGTCGQALKPFGTRCDNNTKYCDAAGICVQCIESSQCTATVECDTASCSAGSCSQAAKAKNTPCSLGYCDGAGTCDECTAASQCTATECTTATCVAGACGTTPEGPGVTCGMGFCDGAGMCVECVAAAQCQSDEICRSNSCVAAIHTVGWETATASSSSVVANTLYLMRLPRLEHAAILTSFGINGTNSAASADMVLYADNGMGTAPTDARLSQGQGFISLIDGARELAANPPFSLNTGQYYWLGFVVSGSTAIKAVGNALGIGQRVLDVTFGGAFPTNPSGASNGGLNYAIWIKVQDVD